MNVASGRSSDVDHAKLKGVSGPLKQNKDGRRKTIHSSPPHNVPTLVSVLSPAWGPKLLSLESTPPRARRSHTVAFQRIAETFPSASPFDTCSYLTYGTVGMPRVLAWLRANISILNFLADLFWLFLESKLTLKYECRHLTKTCRKGKSSKREGKLK